MAHLYGYDILNDNTNSMACSNHNGDFMQAPLHGQSFPQHTTNGQGFNIARQYGGFQQGLHAGNQFDPQVPNFTPNGTELARLHPPTPATPAMAMTRNIDSSEAALERWVVDTHIQHGSDIARVTHLVKMADDEIRRTQETVRHDLQILQAQLHQMRQQLGDSGSPCHELAVVKTGPSILEMEVAPPEVMLKKFDKETVAQVYLEQAEVAEGMAKKLREDVTVLRGISERSEIEVQQAVQANGAKYVVNATEETPTHAPPKRSEQAKQSHEVEIKAPEIDAEKADSVIELNAAELHDDAASVATLTPHSTAWQPLAVRNMAKSPITEIPAANTTTFSWEFLTQELGGDKWSPSFVFVPGSTPLKSHSYWLIEAEYEPFMPSAPGEHGAKLTPFFNDTLTEGGDAPDETAYINVPVFVMKEVANNEYTYFGQYSQLRFSDKVDYDRVVDTVPKHVREYWANVLVDPNRPAWITKALMEHFWPRPKYEGPIPTDSQVNTPETTASPGTEASVVPLEKKVQNALHAYALDLKDWERDAKMKVKTLTAKTILEAFENADADMEPGLRLWWEYFECVGYDQKMYDHLVKTQTMWNVQLKNEAEKEERIRAEAARAAELANGKNVGGGRKTAPAARPEGASKIPAKLRDDAKPQTTIITRFAPQPGFLKQKPAQAAPRPQPASKAASTPAKPDTQPEKFEQDDQASAESGTAKQQANGFTNGDLEAARAFQEKATKAQPRTNSGSKKNARGEAYVPPHQRAR